MNHYVTAVAVVICLARTISVWAQEVDSKPPSEPKRGHAAHRIDDPAIVDDLNPIFLKISVGVLRDDATALQKCVEELESFSDKSPGHRIAVGFAKLVVFLKLADQRSYLQQMRTIVAWQRSDLKNAKLIERRMDAYLAALKDSTQSDWYAPAVNEAANNLWAAPDGLTLDIARRYVALLDKYDEKIEYVRSLQERAKSIEADTQYPSDSRSDWRRTGLQVLSKRAFDLYSRNFRIKEMWNEVQTYFEEFGPDARYSAELLETALKTSLLAHQQGIKCDLFAIPTAERINAWQSNIKSTGGGDAANRLTSAREQFSITFEKPLHIGPVSSERLADDLRLHVPFVASFQNARLSEITERMSVAAGNITVQVAAGSNSAAIVSNSINFNGPLYLCFQELAAIRAVDGNWERTDSGYIIHSRFPEPQEQPAAGQGGILGRRLFQVVNLMFLAGIALWFLGWKKKGKHSPSDSEVADSKSQ